MVICTVPGQQPPNTACTRLVGVGAFTRHFSSFKFSLHPNRLHARPPAGNASRWAVDSVKTFEGVDSMQRTTLKLLLLSVIGVFASACGGNSFASSTATPTLASTYAPQPTNTFTSTVTLVSTRAPILSSPTPEYFVDKNGFEMMQISSGEFSMGSNSIGDKRPAHNVYLDEYYIDKAVVKNADFVGFLNENLEYISVQKIDGVIQDPPTIAGTEIYGQEIYLHGDIIYCIDCFGWDNNLPSQDDWNKSIIFDGKLFSALDGREDYPVTMVNWHGAQAYCSWRKAHLPTEAEWVKAFKQGMERNNQATEWVFDWFAEDYYSHSPYNNPQGPEDGTFRLIAGSDTYSDYMSPDFGFWDISFRCSRSSL